MGKSGVRAAEEKPVAGFIISAIAGVLILLNGLAVGLMGAALLSLIPDAGPFLGGLVIGIGVMFGALVLVGAVLMYKGSTTAGGVLVLTSGILSIVIGGGFVVGFILAIVGGVLGLAGR